MNRFLTILAFVAVIMASQGCHGNGDIPTPAPKPEPVISVDFASGADISWVSEMEAEGLVFTDSHGSDDILSVLDYLGMNAIRLRVWVNPYDTKGWSGQADVISMAKRAFDQGFAVMLDFQYSDIFTAPGRQTAPAAWAGFSGSVSQVAEAVSSYTEEFLKAFKNVGGVPAWVQVGNETNNGMVWDAGRIDWNKTGSERYAGYVTVSNAGYDAVKKVFPDTKVIVHVADAYSAADNECSFFKEFKEAGGKFDIIGLSHYPMNVTEIGNTPVTWRDVNRLALDAIKALSSRFSCQVMVCETGVKPSSEGASCMTSFMESVKRLGAKVCSGVFYWEPEVDGTWKPAIYSNPSLICNGWPAYDLGAFVRSGNRFTPITSVLEPIGK